MILIHTRTPAQPKIYCENNRPLKITLARRSPGAPGPRRVSNLTPRDILSWFQLHSDSNLTPRDIFPQFQLRSDSNFTPRDIFLDSSPTPYQAFLSPGWSVHLQILYHLFCILSYYGSHLKQRFFSQKYLKRENRCLASLVYISCQKFINAREMKRWKLLENQIWL